MHHALVILLVALPGFAAARSNASVITPLASGLAAAFGLLALLIGLIACLYHRGRASGHVTRKAGATFRNADPMALERSHVRLGIRLGCFGCSGPVHEAWMATTQERNESPCCALLVSTPDSSAAAFNAEIAVRELLGEHTNILPLVGRCRPKANILSKATPVLVLFTLATEGNLRGYLRRQREHRPSNVRLLQIATGVACAVAHLADLGVVHGHIAARSYVVTADGTPKLTQFDCATWPGHPAAATARRLTWLQWLAPEVSAGEPCSTASDVWSLGVAIWEVLTLGGTPYEKVEAEAEVIGALTERRRLRQPELFSVTLYRQTLLQCWRMQPASRLSAAKVVDDLAAAIDQRSEERSSIAELEPVAAWDHENPNYDLQPAAGNSVAGLEPRRTSLAAGVGGWMCDRSTTESEIEAAATPASRLQASSRQTARSYAAATPLKVVEGYARLDGTQQLYAEGGAAATEVQDFGLGLPMATGNEGVLLPGEYAVVLTHENTTYANVEMVQKKGLATPTAARSVLQLVREHQTKINSVSSI